MVVVRDLFFIHQLRDFRLVVRTSSKTTRHPITVQRSTYRWQLEQNNNRLRLTVTEGFTGNARLSSLLYLVTVSGKLRSLSKPVAERLTVTDGTGRSEFVLPAIDSTIDFSKGCYRWVVKAKDRAFFSEEHGELCQDS